MIAKYYLDTETFKRLVKSKRGDRNLREVSTETGVSASTLSRVERGKTPDMQTFFILCDWLNCDAQSFFKSSDTVEPEAWRSICSKLRCDDRLAPEVSDALATLIEVACKQKL